VDGVRGARIEVREAERPDGGRNLWGRVDDEYDDIPLAEIQIRLGFTPFKRAVCYWACERIYGFHAEHGGEWFMIDFDDVPPPYTIDVVSGLVEV
jgi:hypothetical protein